MGETHDAVGDHLVAHFLLPGHIAEARGGDERKEDAFHIDPGFGPVVETEALGGKGSAADGTGEAGDHTFEPGGEVASPIPPPRGWGMPVTGTVAVGTEGRRKCHVYLQLRR